MDNTTTHGILNMSRETRPQDWRPWHEEEYGPAGGPQAAHRLGVMMARSYRPALVRAFAQAVGLNPPTASEVGTETFADNVARLIGQVPVHSSRECPTCEDLGHVLYIFSEGGEDEPVYACERCSDELNQPPWRVRPAGVIPCPGAGAEVAEEDLRPENGDLLVTDRYVTDCHECGQVNVPVYWPSELTDETNPFGYVAAHDDEEGPQEYPPNEPESMTVAVPVTTALAAMLFLTNYAEDLAEYAGAERAAKEEWESVRAARNELWHLLLPTQARSEGAKVMSRQPAETYPSGELPLLRCPFPKCRSVEVTFMRASVGVLPSGNRVDLECGECGAPSTVTASTAEVVRIQEYLAEAECYRNEEIRCAGCGWGKWMSVVNGGCLCEKGRNHEPTWEEETEMIDRAHAELLAEEDSAEAVAHFGRLGIDVSAVPGPRSVPPVTRRQKWRGLLRALLLVVVVLAALTGCDPRAVEPRPPVSTSHPTPPPTNCAPGYGCWVITCQEDDPQWDQGETGIVGGCPAESTGSRGVLESAEQADRHSGCGGDAECAYRYQDDSGYGVGGEDQ